MDGNDDDEDDALLGLELPSRSCSVIVEEGTFSSSLERSRRRQSSIFILRRFGMKRSSPAPPMGVTAAFRFEVDAEVVVRDKEEGVGDKICRDDEDSNDGDDE